MAYKSLKETLSLHVMKNIGYGCLQSDISVCELTHCPVLLKRFG